MWRPFSRNSSETNATDKPTAGKDALKASLKRADEPDEVRRLINIEEYGLRERLNDNILDLDGWKGTPDSNTVMIYAAMKGRLNVVGMLVHEFGADPNATNKKGDTPLIAATFNNHEDVVKFLLECDADIYAENEGGESALYWAKHKGFSWMVRALESHAATQVQILREEKKALELRLVEKERENESLRMAMNEENTQRSGFGNIFGSEISREIEKEDLKQSQHELAEEQQSFEGQLAQLQWELDAMKRENAELKRSRDDETALKMKLEEDLAMLQEQLEEMESADAMIEELKTVKQSHTKKLESAEAMIERQSESIRQLEEKHTDDDAAFALQKYNRPRRDSEMNKSASPFFSEWFASQFPMKKSGDVWSRMYNSMIRLGLSDVSFWMDVAQSGNDRFELSRLFREVLHIDNPRVIAKFAKKCENPDLASWLWRFPKCVEYTALFEEQAFVDWEDLKSEALTDEMLQRFGIKSVGHRIRILFYFQLTTAREPGEVEVQSDHDDEGRLDVDAEAQEHDFPGFRPLMNKTSSQSAI